MQSAKKVTISPINENIGVDSGEITTKISHQPMNDKVKSKIYDKLHRFLKIILKIAQYNGYDHELRIKLNDGNYMNKSNIVDLLTHAMSPGKILHGENEFVELLSNSGVDPELIMNDNIKVKLLKFKQRETTPTQEPIVITKSNNESEIKTTPSYKIVNKKNKKRKIEVNDGDTIRINETKQEERPMNKQINNKRKFESLSDDNETDTEIDEEKWKM